MSFLVAEPEENTISHQWKIWTTDWWQTRRPFYECVTSPEVVSEAEAGDKEMSRRRLEALSGLTRLQRAPTVDELAADFLGAGRLPEKAQGDAVHLAFATIYKIDYLLTWNMRHLANAIIQMRLRPVAGKRGFQLPIVCTPLQLMGSIKYEG